MEVLNNTVAQGGAPGGVATTGTSGVLPSLSGSQWFAALTGSTVVPRRSLGSLITPLDARGQPDPRGEFIRPGASMISREQNQRFIAVRFAVRTYRGRTYVDIRTWLVGDDGELFATKKGLSLPKSLLGDLVRGVEALRAALAVPA